jgi:uroporphyrinogen decarboxylase
MNSRERVLAALKHQQTDQVPIGLRFAPELQKQLAVRFSCETAEVPRMVGDDLVTVRPRFRQSASDRYYADPTIQVTPAGHLLDIWRVPFKVVQTERQSYIELAGQPPLAHCDSRADLGAFPWPAADSWDYTIIPAELKAQGDKATWGQTRGFFEIAHFMRGMDQFLMDLAADPEFACALMDRICDYLLDKVRRILTAGADSYVFFEYNDDVASQQSLFMSPVMWREYIKPRMARFCRLIHDHGLFVRYHCCGSCYAIIPDLIEIGVDILNPIQPLATNMDPVRLKREFGKHLCFHGGIDIQELLPRADARTVREAVRRLVSIMGDGGGYILGGSHTLQADIPVENVLALLEGATGRVF